MTGKNEFEHFFMKPELSIQECKNILCRSGENYTEEEIKEIRTFMLHLVEIDFYYFNTVQKEKQRGAKVIELAPNKTENETYREAG